MAIGIAALKAFVEAELAIEGIRSRVEQFVADGTSKAGKRREEIFTREFLCPAIAKYFYEHTRSELELSEEEICKGLGTEGFANCKGFGFTPAHKKLHLFRKGDIVSSEPPDPWYTESKQQLPKFQACPDFAIGSPLPMTILGETKYFQNGTARAAVRQLYDAARQAVFYLGVFRDIYDSALIVIADASEDCSFHRGLALVRPDLLARFDEETKVHLLALRIR